MPQAVTHILTAIVLIELYREWFVKDTRNFPRYYILVAMIGGIFPDFDFLAYYVLYPFFGFTYEQIHRTYFHTLWVPLTFLLIGFVFIWLGTRNVWLRRRRMKVSTVFFILAGTSLLHLVLDAIFWGNVYPFYPFTNIVLGINLITYFPKDMQGILLPTLDGLLLVFWIFWLEFKVKVRDYF